MRQGVSDSRPLGDMTFEVKKGDQPVASFTTDERGQFRVSLPPGHYRILRKDWKSRVGFYGPFEVDIVAGEIKKVEWKCDTGMQ
ncbi:MAG: prealbumin-like fold domain-containing protein [Chthoniobacterales bacterium]|nr:prealbumin-like fold domain-containing protein [Chthoniobacterales bacterium]